MLPESLILPPRTIARDGAVTDLLPECAAFGARGLLVHGASLERRASKAAVSCLSCCSCDCTEG